MVCVLEPPYSLAKVHIACHSMLSFLIVKPVCVLASLSSSSPVLIFSVRSIVICINSQVLSSSALWMLSTTAIAPLSNEKHLLCVSFSQRNVAVSPLPPLKDKMKTFTGDVECYCQPMVCHLWDAKLVLS